MLQVTRKTDAETILSSKAIIASPTISHWTARKFDRKITRELHEQKKMSNDAGRYRKYLVGENDLHEIAQIVSRARAYHLETTLAWLDQEGRRLLPTVRYIDYCEHMNAFKQEHAAAVDKFVPRYPGMIEQAEQRLGEAFDPADYPDPRSIRSKFKFDLKFYPVETADFRCQISSDDADALREQMKDGLRDALEQTQREAMQRAAGALEHMVERLRAFKPADKKKGQFVEGKFHDSLVENVRELVPVLRSFNFAEDKVFDKICDDIERKLCAHDADDLRESDTARKLVANSAEKILADVSQFMA